MTSGLYTAASGMIAERERLDLIGDNLANLSTAGFRAQRPFAEVFRKLGGEAPLEARAANAGVLLVGAYDVPGPGPLERTDRGLDFALPDGVLLRVEVPGSQPVYTRAGSLRISAAGELLDVGGRRVLGAANKPITGLGAGAAVAADGRVVEGDVELGRLGLYQSAGRSLERLGGGLLAAEGAPLAPAGEVQLETGWLERSGTAAVHEMVAMIAAQRAFESYQKVISLTMNEVNRRAVSELAG